MKKNSKSSILLWVLAVLFLLASFNFLKEKKMAQFITGIIISAVLAFFAYKKKKSRNEMTQDLHSTHSIDPLNDGTKVDSYETKVTQNVQSTHSADLVNDDTDVDGYELTYKYDGVLVAYSSNYSDAKVGKFVSLVPEPNNEYDTNAVAVMLNDVKLGYLPKNKLQKMYHDYINSGKIVLAKIEYNNNSSTILLTMYYYKPLTNDFNLLISKNIPHKSFKLTGNSKFQDNISICSVGDEVTFYYDSEVDKMIASASCDIGYIGKSQEEYIDGLESYSAYIEDISENDNGKLTVKVIVFEK